MELVLKIRSNKCSQNNVTESQCVSTIKPKEMFGKTPQDRANFLANYWDPSYGLFPPSNLTLVEGKKRGIESSLMEGSVKQPGAGFYKKTGRTLRMH